MGLNLKAFSKEVRFFYGVAYNDHHPYIFFLTFHKEKYVFHPIHSQ